jgi:RimJ/RimL family protein N-acetyltransferase
MARLKMPRPIPLFEGETVILRPPDPELDTKEYFEMNREPAMHTWTGNCVFATEAEAKAELERFVAMGDISIWVIVDRASGRVVGRFFLCMENRDGIRVVGEGNRIAKPHWRRGHNREARLLLFPYIFGELRADLIETGAWIGNTNSIKSIESYGFQFDREERKWNEKHGREMTMRYYTMTKQQWEATARPDPRVD